MSLAAIFNQFNSIIFGKTGREFLAINMFAGNIFVTANAEDLFKDVEVSADVENYKAMAANALENGLFKKYPPENWEYFLFHEGLGESLGFFFWFKEYRKHQYKKILCICFNPLRAELMKFCPYVNDVVMVDRITFDYISIFYTQKYNIRRILLAHFSPKTIAAEEKLLPDEKKTYGIMGMVRDFLNISSDTKFERYPTELPKEVVARAKKIFDEMNLTQGKVVLVVTSGYCFGNLQHHQDFWIKLRDKLRAEGYEIITNSPQADIPDCQNIFLSLLETAAFAGFCGNIVSIPTGIVDASCTLNTSDKINLQFIFPGYNDSYWNDKTNAEVNQIVATYEYYYYQYFESNVKFFCYKWGNNLAEDDLLLEKIVNNINQ